MASKEIGNVKIGLSSNIYTAIFNSISNVPTSIKKVKTDKIAIIYRENYFDLDKFKKEISDYSIVDKSVYNAISSSGYFLYINSGSWVLADDVSGGPITIASVLPTSNNIDFSKMITFNSVKKTINFEILFKSGYFIPITDNPNAALCGILFFDEDDNPYIYLNFYPFEKNENDTFVVKAVLNFTDL